MFDTVEKMFEQVPAEQLRKHFQEKRVLSANQYGFEADRSTIATTWKLKKFSASVIKKHQFDAAVSLNIYNAFNSVPWTRFMEALENAKVC